MKAVLADPKILKSSIDAISNMIDEASIVVSQDGIALRAMDPAHVALVDFKMNREAFEEYSVEEMLTLGIDLDRLNTILKRAGASDRIELTTTEAGDALRITLSNSATRRFDLPLIDVGEEELRVPQLEFPAKVEIDPKVLSEGIKDAEIVSDHVTLRVDGEALYISARGDLGNVEVRVDKEQAISFSCEEPCRSMFSIEYLKDMVKAGDIASTVRINLGNDIPVKLDFLAPSVSLSFLLAPRIESE
ncbi:MAG: proliferating cell nuclear antigen (pcna) [Euryarchaeota archaeon]|nr:proliferating cell nuclear antigen (pcna) [Euryarchaeota archaeon]